MSSSEHTTGGDPRKAGLLHLEDVAGLLHGGQTAGLNEHVVRGTVASWVVDGAPARKTKNMIVKLPTVRIGRELWTSPQSLVWFLRVARLPQPVLLPRALADLHGELYERDRLDRVQDIASDRGESAS